MLKGRDAMRYKTKPYLEISATILLLLAVLFSSQGARCQEHAELQVQTGKAKMDAAALSPDGRLLLTGAWDHAARLWDLTTGRLIRILSGHGGPVYSVAFSSTGRYALTGSNDATARLWDVTTGSCLHVLSGHADDVESVAFSPDGRLAATGSLDATAKLWDVRTGHEIRTFKGHQDSVTSVAFSPDGRYLLTGSWDKTARLWDTATGKELKVFAGHSAEIHAVSFSPDGRLVLTGSGDLTDMDNTARLWDVQTGHQLHVLSGHMSDVRSVAFSPDSQYVTTGSWDRTARLWSVRTGHQLEIFTGQADFVTAVAFSADGKYVLTAGYDGVARLYDRLTGRRVRMITGQTQGITSVSFSPNGRLALIGGEDKSARLWNLTTGRQTQVWDAEMGEVTSVAFSPDGSSVLVGIEAVDVQGNPPLRHWDIGTGRPLQAFEQIAFNWETRSVAFSPDGQLALTTDSLDAMLWDVQTGQLIKELKGHTNGINSVAFSPDGRLALTGSDDNGTRLWEVTGKLVHVYWGHPPIGANPAEEQDKVNAVAFSPKGRYFVTGDDLGLARIWDTTSPQQIRALSGHDGPVTAVQFSPDGRLVLTGGFDHTARLWDAQTGRQLRAFSGHTAPLRAVSFSPDGRLLLTGSDDGTARLWDTATGKERVALVGFEGGRWAVVDPQGRFDTSELDGTSAMSWLIGDAPDEPQPLEIFMRDYYTPGLLRSAVANNKLPDLPGIARLNRAQPQVEILDVSLQAGHSDRVAVTIRVRSASREIRTRTDHAQIESGAFDLRLFRDGQLVGQYPSVPQENNAADLPLVTDAAREAWRNQHRILTTGERVFRISNIQLPQRKGITDAVFRAYAFNSDRVKSETSSPVSFHLPSPPSPRQPKAYLITMAVGANESGWDLSLALPSAQLAGQIWADKLRDIYEVIPIILSSDTDEDGVIRPNPTATKKSLHAVLDLLAGRESHLPAGLREAIDPDGKLAAATPDDAVVLYVVSHGYADPQHRFYFVPFDTGTRPGIDETLLTRCLQTRESGTHCDPALKFLDHLVSSNELSSWWAGIDGGEMIMVLDTCYAGAVIGDGFRPGPLGDPMFGQLSYDKGMRILAASQPAQTARATHVGRLGHSLLVEALRMAAQSTTDQGITGWLQSSERQLPGRMNQLYSDWREDGFQLPQLLDFSSQRVRPTTAE